MKRWDCLFPVLKTQIHTLLIATFSNEKNNILINTLESSYILQSLEKGFVCYLKFEQNEKYFNPKEN